MVSTRWTILLRSALLAMLLVVAGCQSAPVQEMSDARQAITVAKEAGAAEYASAELKAAMDLLTSAERSLNRREYTQARDNAMQAKVKALDALKVSEASQDDNGN